MFSTLPQRHLGGEKSTLSKLKLKPAGVADSTALRGRVYHYYRLNNYLSVHELLVDLWRMLDNVSHVSSMQGTRKVEKCN